MNDDEIRKIKMALKAWAANHPNPNGIVLQMANGYEYTPQQIADEVEKETDFGKLQLRVVTEALADPDHSLEEILKGFYTSHETHLS
jgi:hypothetical protein